jgi:hypothetical protein
MKNLLVSIIAVAVSAFSCADEPQAADAPSRGGARERAHRQIRAMKQGRRAMPPGARFARGKSFGRLSNGQEAKIWRLTGRGGLILEVTDYGGRLVRAYAPDKFGNLADVTLGWNTPQEYEKYGFSMGTLIGRYGNRIADGTFSLDGFKEGPYLVTATTMDGDTTYEVRAMAGDSVRLVLKPYAGFNVSVVKRDGTPVTQGEYRYLYQDSKGGSKYSTWESFSEATFDINDLREGHYRVEVRVSNDHVSSAPEVMLHNGEYRTLKIQLTEGGVLRGRVVSQMDGRGVRATIEGVGNSLKAATDADGNFVLDQLPDATFDLLIRPENGQEKIFPAIRVSENQEVERSFEVEVTARTRRPRPRGEMARGERGERPAPPWGDGAPPWGDGAPPWGDGVPPWGDGAPPWGNGAPPWGDGAPPWGNGAPPWGNGAPPWGNGAPPTPEGNARTEPSVEPASATTQPQARDGEEASSSRRRGKNGRNWMGGRLSRTGIFKNKAESDAGNTEE